MDSLLSGFIGALIATLLSVLYFIVSGKKKLRSDVFLEIVAYCDNIYKNLREMHVHKDAEYTKQKSYLHPEEYQSMSRELTDLLVTAGPGPKLALVYGEGEVVKKFNELRDYFRAVVSQLRGATRSGWVIEGPQVLRLFSEKIDPLRKDFESMLLKKTHLISIILPFKNKLSKS